MRRIFLCLIPLGFSLLLNATNQAYFASAKIWASSDATPDSTPTSPPREYFSINTIYLEEDNNAMIQVGHDLVNHAYVILPSPNIIDREENRVLFQLYYPDVEAVLTKKYKINPEHLAYLQVNSIKVTDQNIG